VDLRPGGRYSFGWTEQVAGERVPVGPTTLSEVLPGRKLAYGWYYPAEGPATHVTWELEQRGEGTAVRLVHTGFPPDREGSDYAQGWAAFLHLLRLYLERGIGNWE
jgi:uncharacterized protein YndB with AHSA1/START domain